MVVDENTIFSTVIMNSSALPHVECYPRPVMKWTEALLRPVFSPYGNFRLACHGADDRITTMLILTHDISHNIHGQS